MPVSHFSLCFDMTAILEFLYSLFQLISTHLQRKELNPCPLWKSLQTLVIYTSKEPSTCLWKERLSCTGILPRASSASLRGANETPLLSELSAPGLHHLFDTWLLFSCPVVSDSLRPHRLQHASLSSTVSWSLLKLMSIEPVMPSSHLILCRPLLLPPSVFPRSASFPVSLPDGTYIDLAFKQVHPIDSWR